MNESVFWLVFIVIGIILAIIFIFKYGFPTGYKISTTLTFKEAKDYFLIKHYCINCNSVLRRVSGKEYQGKGWSRSIDDGDYTYGERYEIKYILKCPTCNSEYTSNDLRRN
ncbi:hypothetical protein PAECIP111891_07018 [Paenibacillus allorhizoplanae]|uniref:Uncharacterized protein n=2 Tax=Paenibacillus allorhizoplanae TaxID=2905648 RepID=A0ABM9CZ73_9BACL|nr:hypothetical protein PAECIP111891_07018 [Paenibacillus allorhizoplanae]